MKTSNHADKYINNETLSEDNVIKNSKYDISKEMISFLLLILNNKIHNKG